MPDARLLIRWTDGGLAPLLESIGVSIAEGVADLPSARIELGPRSDDAAGAPILDVTLAPESGPQVEEQIDIAAVGWATVELDRAEATIGPQFGTTFVEATRDSLLGASVRRSTNGAPKVALLEPDTEGRLAGALARHGEGLVVLYLSVPGLDAIPAHLATRSGTGPFGPARLLLNGPPAGPFLILLDPAPASRDGVPSKP